MRYLNVLVKYFQTLGGLPVSVVLVGVAILIVITGLIILYQRLKAIGWTDEKKQFIDALQELVSSNKSIAQTLEIGYLSAEHSEIVQDYGYGRKQGLKSELVKKIMDLWEARTNGQFQGTTDEIRAILLNEFKAAIVKIDRDILKLPNMDRRTLDTDKKYSIIERHVGTIANIMINERRKGEVRSRVMSILENIIVTSRF